MQQKAAQPQSQTQASGLLSAVDIWSTGPGATGRVAPAASKPTQKAAATRLPPALLPIAEAPAVAEPVGVAKSLARRVADVIPALRERAGEPERAERRTWPPRKLSLALQGGGSFGAFTWGVLERILEEPGCELEAISGASIGAVNAALLACGFVADGRQGATRRLARFWSRLTNESSFRSLMLIGGFSPAGSSVAFGASLKSGQFDPFDLDPLREALAKDIDFAALRAGHCPRLLVAATRVRDGGLKLFGNDDISPDVLLASTCPPLVHCAVEIDGESYWDGGYSANPPVAGLVRAAESDVLVVQVTPSRDSYIPITSAAIDRRLDQITANSVLNAEIAALESARRDIASGPRIFRIAAEDEIDGLAQRSAVDLGTNFIKLLHRSGRNAADRWLRQLPNTTTAAMRQREKAGASAKPAAEAELV
ncbi:MAG: patatin-like phospholipase family protein [Bradyrhizobium sp.]|uniref:patatin-like phospholipase family protein n=1 Tax=Bradyrhizobium sp. TaxID=376 RepID=UPI001D3825E2|nr:patatin-like phospholipase family protein [Bradyrhizobium sp.]MBV9559262.1 patatin-like phospholipase family protein [Bradyrhizobium sp.]